MPKSVKDFTVALKPKPTEEPILTSVTVMNTEGTELPVTSLSSSQSSSFVPELGYTYTFTVKNPDQQVRVITIETINVLDVDSKPEKPKVNALARAYATNFVPNQQIRLSSCKGNFLLIFLT